MSLNKSHASSQAALPVISAARVHLAFVLLFAVTPDAALGHTQMPVGLQPIPDDISESYRGRLEAMQKRLLVNPTYKPDG
jgi:hypothetical protein